MMNAPAHLLERIGAAFPTLPLSSVRIDPDGLVNDVVIVNGAWVCRFANDERGVEALTRETHILELVRRSVDVSVPAFEHREADFVAYRLIQGLPLNRHDLLELRDNEQGRLADQLATFLRQLHGVSHTELDRAAIPRSDAQRTPEDWQQLFALPSALGALHGHLRRWRQALPGEPDRPPVCQIAVRDPFARPVSEVRRANPSDAARQQGNQRVPAAPTLRLCHGRRAVV